MRLGTRRSMHCDAIVRGSRCSSESTKYQQPLNKSSIRSWADVRVELLRQTCDYAEVQCDAIALDASDNRNDFLLSRNSVSPKRGDTAQRRERILSEFPNSEVNSSSAPPPLSVSRESIKEFAFASPIPRFPLSDRNSN